MSDIAHPQRLPLPDTVEATALRAELSRTLTTLAPRVRRWLLGALGPRSDLDDATQDALVELARALPTFRGDSRLSTFAHRITIRVAYRYYRRRDEPTEPLSAAPEQSGGADPETRAIHREALVRMHRLLTKLSDRRRAVFTLCALEGMTDVEASEVLEMSPTAIRSNLHRARADIVRMVAHDDVLGPLAARGRS